MTRPIKILLLILAVMLTGMTLFSAYASIVIVQDAHSLRITQKAATQLNCRAGVVNNASDAFRHKFGDGFDAAESGDLKRLKKVIKDIRDAVPTNEQIKRKCGADAVDSSPIPTGRSIP